jgi:hypothetical protein
MDSDPPANGNLIKGRLVSYFMHFTRKRRRLLA